MALLFRDELQRSHYAPLLSKTSCIYFILVLICIALPFILVVRTHSKYNQVACCSIQMPNINALLRFRFLGCGYIQL